MEKYRDSFERWAMKPPRSWDTTRLTGDSAWTGNYWDYHVECAWQTWAHVCAMCERRIKEAAGDEQ